MSLKTLHLIFISASTALAFGFGVWEFKAYWSSEGRVPDLLLGLGSIAVGVGLIIYERYFLKRLKNVGYL
jgi:hypothetical protein